MQKGFKFFLTILFVVALVFSVEGCSDFYKDSETANVSFSLNLPKEFFASRNAQGDVNEIDETKSNYIKITLCYDNGTQIDEKEDYIEERKKISFDSIPVGSTVYATAEADINGVQYKGKTEPEFIKRGVNTLKLVLYEISNAPSDEEEGEKTPTENPENPEPEPEPDNPSQGEPSEPEEPTEPNYYKVTFNSKGGYFVLDNLYYTELTSTVDKVKPYVMSPLQPENSNSEYVFIGWYQKNDDGSFYAEPFNFGESINGDVTLYAVWEKWNSNDFVLVNGGEVYSNTYGQLSNTELEGYSPTDIKPFYICQHEVTQAEYRAVMEYKNLKEGTNYITEPSQFQGNPYSGEDQENRPVENVTWYDAILYCITLSEKENLTPVYKIIDIEISTEATTENGNNHIISATVEYNDKANGYRLPTSEEWEFAARSGDSTKSIWDEEYSNSTYLDTIGWEIPYSTQ